jgi:uncharacterized membrane protein
MPIEFSAIATCALILLTCYICGFGALALLPESLIAPLEFLSLSLGAVFFLVSFSLVAKIVPGYQAAIPLSILVALLPLLFKRGVPLRKRSAEDMVCFVVFFIVAGVTLYLHHLWPAIRWENSFDAAGTEKLFNLSFNQSFLYGSGFPPGWIWLSGEQSSYYILPRALPGLSSWLARVLFAEPATAGVQVLLWEAILVGLSAASVCAWTIILLNLQGSRSDADRRTARVVGLFLGFFSFLEVHLYGLWTGLHGFLQNTPINWWQFAEQIAKYSSNQYPIWLVILGDSHSYSQVIPLQLALWGTIILLLLEGERNIRLALLAAVSLASVLLSHAGSVLIDIVAIVPALATLILLYWRSKSLENLSALLKNLFAMATLAVLLAFPNLRMAGRTKRVFPGSELTTTIFEFFSVQFSVLLWIAVVVVVVIGGRVCQVKQLNSALGSSERASNLTEWGVAASFFFVGAAFLFLRPVVGVSLSLSILLPLLAISGPPAVNHRVQKVSALLLISIFSIWIFPELIALDHADDNRTLWIRFNIILRFWPEGYYLIPLIVAFAFGASLHASLRNSGIRGGFYAVLGVIVALFAVSHVPAIRDRANRASERHSLNGLDFIREEFPEDQEIVDYLVMLPETPQVLVGEGCGTKLYPLVHPHYSWPGRLSAYSGRRSVCGWARHALLFQAEMKNGESTWSNLQRYEAALLRILVEAGAPLPGWDQPAREKFMKAHPSLEEALKDLRARGVSHLLYGSNERAAYGFFDLERLAEVVGGSIAMKGGRGTGVVSLSPAASSE